MTDRRDPSEPVPETRDPRPTDAWGGAPVSAAEVDGAHRSLDLAVARLRKRAWLVHGGAAALAWLGASLLVAGAAALALGLGAGLWIRPLAWALLLGLGAAAVIHAARRAGAPSRAGLARTLEDRDPRAAGLTTAVELAAALRAPTSGKAPAFSVELAKAHVADAAARAIRVGPELAFPLRPLARAAAAAGGVALLFAVGLWSLRPLATGLALLGDALPGGEAPAPKATPITGNISLTYHYPRYTGLPPKTVTGTGGAITALRGTQVELETQADRDVARAFLDVGDAATPLKVEGDRQLSGTLQVQGPGSYAFRFENGLGDTLAVGPSIPITAVDDGIPSITLQAPVPELVLTEDDAVDLRFDAADDFGVAAVELVFKAGPGEEQHVPIAGYPEPNARASGTWHWELSTLGVEPGDEITYYLRAKDNDEVSGAKWGQSRTQTIKIFSAAEHRRELIAKVEQAWEKMILALGDRIAPREGPRKVEGPARIQAGRQADAEVVAVTTDLQDVSRELAEDESAPQELLAAVTNVSRELAAKGLATRSIRRRGLNLPPHGQASLLPRLDAAEAAEQHEMEKAVLYLEALLDRQRLLQIQELSDELAADRRKLAEVLEKYRDAPTDEAKAEITRELARMKARMAELMQRMAQLGKGIQDEHLNAEAMQAMAKDRDMMGQLDQVQRLLAEGKTDEALRELQKLGMQMDEMAQALSDASQGQAENDPALQALAEDMQKYEADLNRLARDQADLAEDTARLRKEQTQALRERLSRRDQALLEGLQKKIERARAKLATIPETEIPQSLILYLGGASERLGDLGKALEAKDFDAAQESAASALAHAQALEQELGLVAERRRRFEDPSAGRMQTLHHTAGEVTPIVQEIKDEIDRLFASPREQMTPQQRAQMQRLAQRQQALRDRMGKLRSQADEIGQQAPIFGEDAHRSMSGAEQAMGDAQSRLRGQRAGGALASERSALDHLQSLQRGLEEAKQRAMAGGGGGGFPLPIPGGRGGGRNGQGQFDGKEKVAIPGADQFKAPEAFRKDILDAMKKDAPEGFEEPVHDYYQELVK